MIFYHLLFGMLLIAILLSLMDNRYDKYIFNYLTVILIVFAGFRYGIGVDYFSYYDVISYLSAGVTQAMEPGYLMMAKLISVVGGKEQLLYLLSSTITVIFIAKYIIEFSHYRLLSLYIYVTMPILYFASFNGIRQFIAVAIFSFSIKYILNKSFFKFISLLLIASTFHITVILMIPCYFIFNRCTKVKHLILLTLGYLILVSSADVILNLLHMSPKYLSDYYENEGVNYKSLISIPLFIFFMIFRSKLSSAFSGANTFIIMIYISALLAVTPLFSGLPAVLINRMTSYFTIALIILVPNFISIINDRYMRYIYLSLILLFPALYYYSTLIINGEAYMLVPYEANFKLF